MLLMFIVNILVPLKDKKSITNCKPNKICVDRARKFYDKSVKSWLQDNDQKFGSGNYIIRKIEEKSVIAGRFIRTLQNKVYKYMKSVPKNIYINKLGDIVNKYSNTYHTIIKIKPIDVKSGRYFGW